MTQPWRAGLVGLGLGGMLGGLSVGPDAWRAWSAQVHAAQALASTPEPAQVVAVAPPRLPWPEASGGAALAAQVLARLQAHGLEVRSMELGGIVPVTALPGLQYQTLTWQLQGRREDWVAAWSDLVAQGPLWTLQSWQLVPEVRAGGPDDRVMWQGQWQQWMHSAADSARAIRLAPMPPRPERRLQAAPPTRVKARPPMAPTVAAPPRPDLLGLQQAHASEPWQAWLRPHQADHAVLVQAGQDLPPAWRVLTVDPQGVWLQAAHANATPVRLPWPIQPE